MLYTFEYDASHIPSIPVVEIAIGPALSQPTVALTAIVDSGADTTIIPTRYLNRVRARPGENGWLRGLASQRIPVDFYTISFRIGSYALSDIVVVGAASLRDAILGRDILNQLIVTLNGLASTVEIAL
jgi:hypothetical protein